MTSTNLKSTSASSSTSPEKRTSSPPLKSITDIQDEDLASAGGAKAEGDDDVKTKTRGTGTEGIGKGVPAFLVKLFSMINDPATDNLIYWSHDGLSFFIPNHQAFGSTLLPQFFKHANFTSFVRQLNMYNFKKVPHLHTAALSSYAPGKIPSSTAPSTSSATPATPPPELWEFTNPKFMRSHPELLGGITRKKSAKEIAAAKALELAEQQGEGPGKAGKSGKGKKSVRIKERGSDSDEDEEDDEDGEGGDVDMDASGSRPSRASGSTYLKPDSTTDPALSQALTLMSSTHSSLREEVEKLRSSNELLWKAAMTAREEQERSQKKLDGVIRFLAGQFGGMNVGMLLDGDGKGMDQIGGVDGIKGKGKGKELGSPRLMRARLGKERMIGDGIQGLDTGTPEDNERGDGDDVEMEGSETGDGEAGLWEIGPDGGMRPMNSGSTKSPLRPGIARHSSNAGRRSYAKLPANGRPSSPPTTERFVRLDTSPEGKKHESFGPTSVETPASSSTSTGGALFPPLPSASATPSSGTNSETAMVPSYMNAMTAYQPSPTLGYNLHPDILQMPLGDLLKTPAGAQLLASLGQGSTVGGLLGHQNLGSALGARNGGYELMDDGSGSYAGPPQGTLNPAAASSSLGSMGLPREDIKPSLDEMNWLNDIPLNNSIGDTSMQNGDMLNPDILLNNPAQGDAGAIDWNDPQMAAFLEQLAGPPDGLSPIGGRDFYPGPNGAGPYTGTLAQAQQASQAAAGMSDVQALDYDSLFHSLSSPEGSGIDDGGELKEPVSKKRKTDERG